MWIPGPYVRHEPDRSLSVCWSRLSPSFVSMMEDIGPAGNGVARPILKPSSPMQSARNACRKLLWERGYQTRLPPLGCVKRTAPRQERYGFQPIGARR
jgi:hypothetical protein